LGRLAGGEPFGESELEPLTLFDLEPFGLDVAERTAQEVLSLERLPLKRTRSRNCICLS
jgi:hypothetical protein